MKWLGPFFFSDIWRTEPSELPPNVRYRRSKPFEGTSYRLPLPPKPKRRRKRP